MRKISIIVMIALVALLTQCKKNNVTPEGGDKVQMILEAGYGGEKTSFDPNTLGFNWAQSSSTEYIYVGSSVKGYLGELSGTGTGATTNNKLQFSGSITAPDGTYDEKLYFFYLGNGQHTNQTTLDFSDQSAAGTTETVTNYLVASAEGTVRNDNGTYYATADLQVKMAIAYFNVNAFKNSSSADEAVFLSGDKVYATATVNYQTGEITPGTKGFIKLGKNNNSGKYVALIPSVSTATDLKFDSNSKTGSMTFNNGIQAGWFYSNSNSETPTPLTVSASDPLKGSTPGLFSVAGTTVETNKVITKMVRFSKGNLQFTRTNTTENWDDGTWSFMENQWNTVDVGGQIEADYSNRTAISLFGWGTSGYDSKKYPYMTSTTATYGNGYNNITDTDYDWGIYNKISNGGNQKGMWCVLSKDEGRYLFHDGKTAHRFAGAIVNGKSGVILLPDDWDPTTYILTYVDNEFGGSFSYTANTIASTDWTGTLEKNGAVFLPAAGYRNGTSVLAVNNFGAYWTTSCHETDAQKAYYKSFYNSEFDTERTYYRYMGHSVRLVKVVN